MSDREGYLKRRDQLLMQDERIAELEAENKALREDREKLWMLLDDIDTAEDMFKPEINNHFRYVNKTHRLRFKVFDPPEDWEPKQTDEWALLGVQK